MLLYIMLYIVLAYSMLFAALTNAVCLNNASILPLISANAYYFHALSLFIDTWFVFPNSMLTPLLLLSCFVFM